MLIKIYRVRHLYDLHFFDLCDLIVHVFDLCDLIVHVFDLNIEQFSQGVIELSMVFASYINEL